MGLVFMATPIQRSIRLIGRSADFLDRTSGSSGEIALDSTNQTLRLFNGNTPGGVVIGGSTGSTVTVIPWEGTINLDTPSDLGQQYNFQIPITSVVFDNYYQTSSSTVTFNAPSVNGTTGFMIGQVRKMNSQTGEQLQTAGGQDNTYTITAIGTGFSWARINIVYSGIKNIVGSNYAIYQIDSSLYHMVGG